MNENDITTIRDKFEGDIEINKMFEEFSKERSDWEFGNLPCTETLRRITLLLGWAVTDPKRADIYVRYYMMKHSVAKISEDLKFSIQYINRLLRPVRKENMRIAIRKKYGGSLQKNMLNQIEKSVEQTKINQKIKGNIS